MTTINKFKEINHGTVSEYTAKLRRNSILSSIAGILFTSLGAKVDEKGSLLGILKLTENPNTTLVSALLLVLVIYYFITWVLRWFDDRKAYDWSNQREIMDNVATTLKTLNKVGAEIVQRHSENPQCPLEEILAPAEVPLSQRQSETQSRMVTIQQAVEEHLIQPWNRSWKRFLTLRKLNTYWDFGVAAALALLSIGSLICSLV
tara:strand:+ start:63 stop:674 length:612 start_codon:yes stop_codon:yes gene_type:complete